MRGRLALAVVLLSLGAGAAAAPGDVGPRVGERAPGFSMASLGGETVSLAGLTERGPVLLVFWSTRCHFCHALIPRFKEIHAAFGPQGMTLAAVNVGYEDRAEVATYAADNALDYLILNDDEKKVPVIDDYELVGTPTFVVVDRQGIVRYHGHTLPALGQWVDPAGDGPGR